MCEHLRSSPIVRGTFCCWDMENDMRRRGTFFGTSVARANKRIRVLHESICGYNTIRGVNAAQFIHNRIVSLQWPTRIAWSDQAHYSTIRGLFGAGGKGSFVAGTWGPSNGRRSRFVTRRRPEGSRIGDGRAGGCSLLAAHQGWPWRWLRIAPQAPANHGDRPQRGVAQLQCGHEPRGPPCYA